MDKLYVDHCWVCRADIFRKIDDETAEVHVISCGFYIPTADKNNRCSYKGLEWFKKDSICIKEAIEFKEVPK